MEYLSAAPSYVAMQAAEAALTATAIGTTPALLHTRNEAAQAFSDLVATCEQELGISSM